MPLRALAEMPILQNAPVRWDPGSPPTQTEAAAAADKPASLRLVIFEDIKVHLVLARRER
jgi:hypothetical protein